LLGSKGSNWWVVEIGGLSADLIHTLSSPLKDGYTGSKKSGDFARFAMEALLHLLLNNLPLCPMGE
jgi:hypothetical protein